MAIIFKFVLKSIKEKKFRAFLILFSIMMSSALFFAAGAMSNSMEKMVVDRIRKVVGSSEIMIHAGSDSPSPFVSTAGAERFKEKVDYAVGCITGSAVYETEKKEHIRLNLYGYSLEELQSFNPISFSTYGEVPFVGKRLIVSSLFAKENSISVGDNITITIRGSKHRFSIAGIANDTGLFTDDGRTSAVVVPRETLAAVYGVKGSVSTIFIKPAAGEDKGELIRGLSRVYEKYKVAESIPMEDIKRETDSMTIPFMMMVVMVMLISVFIIYTSFRVITAELMPVVGTFRSIGATRKMTDIVLLSQSLIYGIIGGALGCIMGIGILWVMSRMMMNMGFNSSGFAAAIDFEPQQMGFAFLSAVLLSIVSSIIPILKASKLPVKDIVLNTIERKTKKSNWKLIAGLMLFAAVVTVPPFIPREHALIVNSAVMTAACISIVLLIPYITHVFLRIFEAIYLYVFGNEGVLAAKNLRDNKNMLNNISLLAMGISTILLINTISFSVFKEVTNGYKNLNYDIELSLKDMDRSALASLRRIEGVKDVYGSYITYDVELSDGKSRLIALIGADTKKHLEYYDVGFDESHEVLLERLSQDRNIFISKALQTKFKLNEGDYMTIKTPSGYRDYKVIGFFDSIMWNGQVGFISDKYFIMDMKQRSYTEILIKTSEDVDLVVDRIKTKFKSTSTYISTIRDMEERNQNSNEALFNIFRIFSIMTMVIGVFGVLNNYAISFIERKRGLAMMRSMGMNKLQTVKMIFIEALSGGLIGGTIGVIMGVLLIMTVPYVLRAIDLPIKIHYSVPMLLSSILAGVVVAVVASISPALKSSKFNIIEAVKYE